MRKEGVNLDRELPGTVLTVEEALTLIVEDIKPVLIDRVRADPTEALVRSIVEVLDAENTRRENAREVWEKASVELHGVTLTVGGWYAVTEGMGFYRRSERTFRFCQYLGRRGFGGDDDRVTYVFMKWSQSTAKKFDPFGRGTKDSYTARGITKIVEAEPTPMLLKTVEYAAIPYTGDRAKWRAENGV